MYRLFFKHRTATILGIVSVGICSVLSIMLMGFQAAHYEVKVQTAMVDSNLDHRYLQVDELLHMLNGRPSHWERESLEEIAISFQASLTAYRTAVTAQEKAKHVTKLERGVHRVVEYGERIAGKTNDALLAKAIRDLRVFNDLHRDQLATYHRRVDEYNRWNSRVPKILSGGKPVVRIYPVESEIAMALR